MSVNLPVWRRDRALVLSWIRIAVAVPCAALLCSCGAGVPKPAGIAVTVVAPASSAALSGPPHPLRASEPASSGGHKGDEPPSATAPAEKKSADIVHVSKCYTNATPSRGGELLIKADSSDRSARLFAYRSDGALIGELQNGGASRYGGTVMPYQLYDPVRVTIKSSAGGSVTVPTTRFQPDS